MFAAVLVLLVSAAMAWAVCCPELDFAYGTEDREGLAQSCGYSETDAATRLSLDALTIYRVSTDEFVFVHDRVGCIGPVFKADALFVSDLGRAEGRSVLLTSSETANVSISWDENDLVFYFSVIQERKSR